MSVVRNSEVGILGGVQSMRGGADAGGTACVGNIGHGLANEKEQQGYAHVSHWKLTLEANEGVCVSRVGGDNECNLGGILWADIYTHV